MNPVVANALTTTATATVGEMAKLATNIVEYKKATYAIDAELVKVEYGYELELAQIKADKKSSKKKIMAHLQVFEKQLKFIERDKKALRRQMDFCFEQALNFNLSAEERQEAKMMAEFIAERLDKIDNHRQESYAQFSDSLERVSRPNRNRRMGGMVVDVDYTEI